MNTTGTCKHCGNPIKWSNIYMQWANVIGGSRVCRKTAYGLHAPK